MMPSFGGVGGGKLTVIKAGPGFHEEKSYNIAADGHLTQTGDVTEVSMLGDGLDHANPMDSQFSSDDVEVFTVDSVKPATEAAATEAEEKSPVMDVRGLEEQQPKQEPKQEPEEAKVEAKEFASEKLPYLSVLRNEVGESDRYLHIWISIISTTCRWARRPGTGARGCWRATATSPRGNTWTRSAAATTCE